MKKGVSSVLSSVLIIFVVIVAISIISISVFKITNEVDSSSNDLIESISNLDKQDSVNSFTYDVVFPAPSRVYGDFSGSIPKLSFNYKSNSPLQVHSLNVYILFNSRNSFIGNHIFDSPVLNGETRRVEIEYGFLEDITFFSYTPIFEDGSLGGTTYIGPPFPPGVLLNGAINVTNDTINETRNCLSPVQDGLIAYYCFENMFNDSSPKLNHAKEYGGVLLLKNRDGNTYAKLDGINDYLTTNASKDFVKITESNEENKRPDTLTVSVVEPMPNTVSYSTMSTSFWMRYPLTNGKYFVMGNDGASNTNTNFYILLNVSELKNTLEFIHPSCAEGFAMIPKDVFWHNYAIVREKTRYSIYVDGNLTFSKTCGPNTLTTSTTLYIGRNLTIKNAEWINGSFDEIMLYNRSLNSQEVRTIYTNLSRMFGGFTFGNGGIN